MPDVQPVRFNRLDLNLLVVLEALLRERSVSKVAQQLHLSQPAVSAALGRLREYFNDEILVVHGKKMMPTAHALSMEPMVFRALEDVKELISASTVFAPEITQRVFRIVTPEHVYITLLLPLVAQLEKTAPNLKLDVMPLTPEAPQKLESGEIDFLLTPEQGASKGHPGTLLFEERHVVVGCKQNPVFQSGVTEETFLSCGHILVSHQHGFSYCEQEMRELNRRRRIEIICPSLMSVPWMLSHSLRLAVMPQRVANAMARQLPLATAPLPGAFPATREVAQYHVARASDSGIQWMLQRMLEHAALV
jgi:DNA-binding transcriptional LysR family regulator